MAKRFFSIFKIKNFKMKNYSFLITLKKLPEFQKDIILIKKDFLLKDVKYKYELNAGGSPVVDLKESKALVEVLIGESYSLVKEDEFGFEEKEITPEYDLIEFEFKEEFEKSLKDFFKTYCKKFIEQLDVKNIYTLEMLSGYKKMKFNKINSLISFFQKNSDMNDSFKDLIIQFCKDCYEFISNFNLNEVMVGDKLKFKLKKNELILLFQIMWDKEVILGISESDLYRILEDKTLYTDNNGNYCEMKYVSQQANKLKQGHNSPKFPGKRLSEIFHKSFFTSSK
jgi:hypothetical protein